jgi:hypothetical protein
MNSARRKVSPNAFLLATATIGVGALVWNARQKRRALALRAAQSNAPVWARATAIVARSAGALLLLVRQKGRS